MVSFYPGPSRLDPGIEKYMHEALECGILSQNHRSTAFMELYENTWSVVKSYLGVPENYALYFISSATECWEILSQELVSLENVHVFNGSFGEKGYLINRAFHPEGVKGITFDKNELPAALEYKADVIHLTQNETSNGTQLSSDWIKSLRQKNPNAIITVDATSSLGGQLLPIDHADIWYASVQKCLGLPSGMGIMICSPKLAEYCKKNHQSFYNSISALDLQFQNRQTTHTPNILNIYLLYRSLSERTSLHTIHEQLQQQANTWYQLLHQHALFQSHVSNANTRSNTVIAVEGKNSDIESFKQYCNAQNYIIGNGYGANKTTTFRIANFPSHQEEEVATLQQLLVEFK